MKSITKIESETKSKVLSLSIFLNKVLKGEIMPYEYDIYYHDGYNITEKSVWDSKIEFKEILSYPYVCCYKK